MSKKLVLSVPNVPDDEIFEVPGLGVFPNGTHDVSDEQAHAWELQSGFHWPSQDVLSLPVTADSHPLKPLIELHGEETVVENPLALPPETDQGEGLPETEVHE